MNHSLHLVNQKHRAPVVGISGLHRGENPQPGAAVVGALRRVWPSMRVVGLAYDALESGIYAQGDDRLDAIYTMPYPTIGRSAYLERLAQIQVAEGLNAVIPCLDTDVELLCSATDALSKLGIHTYLPTPESVAARDKTQLAKLAQSVDCPSPRTCMVRDRSELHRAAAALGQQVFVKGRLYDAKLCSTAAELEIAFQSLLTQWGAPVVVQERIEGEEFNIVGVGDGDGGIDGMVAIRKMLKSSAGKGFAGIVVNDPVLLEHAQKLVAKLSWRGPFELEFVYSKPKTDYFLLEINPRFPAWVGFPASLGCNLPALALDCAFSTTPRRALAACEPGNFFIRHSVDLAGKLEDLMHLTVDGAFTRSPVEADTAERQAALVSGVQA
jgi:carbamoyl-phosphate synthase large subunit